MALRIGQRLSRSEHVRLSRTFQFVQRKGIRRTGPLLALVSHPGPQPWTRLGLTVSRKVGQATVRNLLKRRLRDIFRRHKPLFPPGCDVIIIVKTAAATASFQTLEQEVLRLCLLLKPRPPRPPRPHPPGAPSRSGSPSPSSG